MSEIATSPPADKRGRGRGKSRGGLGKYLRARGRGRGRGRPAEFVQRLVPEHEQDVEPDEEDVKLMQAKYSARGLKSNSDRYIEAEPDPDEEPELEVDLSAFLEKQRTRATAADDASDLAIIGAASVDPPEKGALTSAGMSSSHDASNTPDEGEIDHELERMMLSAQIGSGKGNAQTSPLNRKNKKQVLEWDEAMENMHREKIAAEAMRDLKTRLQGNQKLQQAPVLHTKGKQVIEDTRVHPSVAQNHPLGDAEDFLDDLLG